MIYNRDILKIAYIYSVIPGSSFSVNQKVKQQAKALDELRYGFFDLIVLNTSKDKKEGRIRYINYKKNKFFVYYYLLFKRYKLIEDSFDLSKYNLIIMRYPGADKSGLNFVTKYNVIFEFHSKVIEEIDCKLKNTKNFLRRFARKILLKHEKKYGKEITDNAKGQISVTEEIKEYYKSFRNNVPTRVISNGTNVKDIKKTGFKSFSNPINLVFIGSRPEKWNGLDRLIKSIEDYRKNNNDIFINLHIIGRISQDDLPDYQHIQHFDVIFHGERNKKEIDVLVSDMQLAISKLCMFRIKLKTTASLKVCEYISRGIPFIIGNEDENIKYLSPKCFMQYENDNSLINFNSIIDFVKKNSENRKGIIEEMREYALKYIDWKVKLKQYKQFCEEIFNE